MSAERIHHLDWLKAVIVYGIVGFHVALVFSYGSWLVTNPQRSLVLSAIAGFCFPWGIPAMFLIAGADAWFGLRSHSVGDFIRKRFLRLLVPMVPGLIILSPIQRFVVSSNPPPTIDRLPGFYVDFFRGFHVDWTLQFVSQYWLHLWFLGYLFAISLVCAPLLHWLHGPSGRLVTARLADEALRRGLLIFVLPLMLTQVVLRPFFPLYQDWADLATYTVAFLWGAVVFGDRRFDGVIVSHIRSIFVTALLSTAFLGAALLLYRGGGQAAQVLHAIAWSLYIWSWLHVVLYVGIRWLNFPSRVIAYMQESVLPIYVIHHPFVLLIASFVVSWSVGVWPKFAVILIAVLAITVGIYELGVRRWNVTRVIFGLEPLRRIRRRAAAPAPAPAAGARPSSSPS